MKKLISSMIAVVLSTAPLTAHALTGSEVQYANLDEGSRVTRIVSRDGFGCTGVLIDPEWVLTAKHCFPQPELGATITFGIVKTNYPFHADVIVPHHEKDVALVHMSEPMVEMPPIRVADSQPSKWGTYTTYGWGGTSSLTKSQMTLKTKNGKGEAPVHYRTTSSEVNVVPGDSGGPTLNSRGEVVGVSHAAASYEDNKFNTVYTENMVDLKPWIAKAIQKPLP